jgi:hypothetical protein
VIPIHIKGLFIVYGGSMSNDGKRQFCAVCAWRENCAKKFCVPDGGAHCPDYTRDVLIKDPDSSKFVEELEKSEGKGA